MATTKRRVSRKSSADRRAEPDPNLKLLNGIYSFHCTGIIPTYSPGWGPSPFYPIQPQWPVPEGVTNYIPRQTLASVGVLKFDGWGGICGWGVINHDGAVSQEQIPTPPLNQKNGAYTVSPAQPPDTLPFSGEVNLTLRAAEEGTPAISVMFKYVMADNWNELYMVQIMPSFPPGIKPPTVLAWVGLLPIPNPSIGGTVMLIAKKI